MTACTTCLLYTSDHYRLNRDNFSRGVRYHINTEDMTIRQVWQYGKERKNDFFSSYISNVEYYRDGYYLIHSGGMGYNHGVTCEELPVYMNLEDPECVLKSITVEVMDGEVVYEMHLPSNYYRAEKMSLYHAVSYTHLKDGSYYILDWAHATQGNASADAAITYLMFVLQDQKLADTYLRMFCDKSDTWLLYTSAGRLKTAKKIIFNVFSERDYAIYRQVLDRRRSLACRGGVGDNE